MLMLQYSYMKLRSATPASTSFRKRALLVALTVFIAFAVPLQLTSHIAQADRYDDQINALEQEIAQYQAEASRLSGEAQTLQNEVTRLNNEKAVIQAQVDLSQAKYDKLIVDIADTEQKIKDNQEVLGDTIADLYVDGGISPLEMLASSTNVGDYLDKQEYRNSIRDQLVSTISEIKDLKAQLDQQKIDVERVLNDQKGQRDLLAKKEAEQQALLAQTRGQEAAYAQLSEAAKAQKQQVQQEQQAAIAAASNRGGTAVTLPGDPNKGGYPAEYANASYYAYIPDRWGMYARQCVSYVAWKVYQKNGYMPYWGGVGNANQWPGNARSGYGNGGTPIATGYTPRVGSAGVIMAGEAGHIVWVEAVNGDGTIDVSQYNYYNAGGSGWGHYSKMRVSASTYDVYIYF